MDGNSLRIESVGGRGSPIRLHAEGLARAFAKARLARPDLPLVPELQVVLAHLMAQSGEPGLIEVPDDPSGLIDEALDNHLRRALETAFPCRLGGEAPSQALRARTRALLALRKLATSTGERDEGLTPEEMARAIGEGGEEILDKLATPLTRLVVLREGLDGLRYTLSHDRMAEAVVRLVEEQGRRGQLLVDAELLDLRRFVTLRTALYHSRGKLATRLPRQHYGRIAANAEALLWDAEQRAWWSACRKRRRTDQRRWAGLATAAVIFLTLVATAAWSWARQRAEHRALLERVVQGEPEAALRALDRLAKGPEVDVEELLSLLQQREVAMDVLGRGLGTFSDSDLSAAVLRVVEIALPWVEQSPDDPVLIANLVWPLDFGPARDPRFAERAVALRNRVLEPVRQLRPPPELPGPEDPEWVDIPAGSFPMGTAAGKEGDDDERPQHQVSLLAFRMLRHEVTNAEYRRLAPDHRHAGPEGGDQLPVAFVSWSEAYTYAAWLGGRLPTEAEWEYAARAGCPHAYCTRERQQTTVDQVAWSLRSSRDPTTGQPASRPVMQLEPNPWGLYDMLGNLWEWTADWYAGYPADPQHNPWPWAPSDGKRADRGGSFWSEAGRTCVANRSWGARAADTKTWVFAPCSPSRPELWILDH